MSIDLTSGNLAGNGESRSPNSTDSRIRDLIIVYGGWGVASGGDPLENDGSGTAGLIDQLKGITPPPFHKILILALQGSLPSRTGVSKGLNFITMNFHPLGDLIIYGYSAGGTDALTLCREVEKKMSFIGLSSGQFHAQAQAEELRHRGIEESAKVRVDLLITVDAASGPVSGMVDRLVSRCVRLNLNFFQTKASRIGSHGGPNQAEDNKATNIDNEDLTGQTEHASIDESTNDRAMKAIHNQLDKICAGD